MAEQDSTADIAVQQMKKDKQERQWAKVEDGLYQLLCRVTFYQEAIEAITALEEPNLSNEWQLGLLLTGEDIQQHGQLLQQQLQKLKA